MLGEADGDHEKTQIVVAVVSSWTTDNDRRHVIKHVAIYPHSIFLVFHYSLMKYARLLAYLLTVCTGLAVI